MNLDITLPLLLKYAQIRKGVYIIITKQCVSKCGGGGIILSKLYNIYRYACRGFFQRSSPAAAVADDFNIMGDILKNKKTREKTYPTQRD